MLENAKQKEGSYLICSLGELVGIIQKAGFTKILEKDDSYYRGMDNFVVAMR